MRLIDADETLMDAEHMSAFRCSLANMEDLNILIGGQETIDAVPVVRCRECKHLNVVNRKELYAHCPKTNTVFLPFELDTREHFCSLGERKEGADNEP